jgi:transcriptional regulator with XRE-family HTH domain
MFKNSSGISAPLRQSISAKIRGLMRQQGLTTETAALNMGLEYSNFYYIVRGKKTPRLETLIKIASGFNVRPEYFLNDFSQPNSAAKVSSLKFNILKEIDKLKLPEQAFLLNVLKLRNVKSKLA